MEAPTTQHFKIQFEGPGFHCSSSNHSQHDTLLTPAPSLRIVSLFYQQPGPYIWSHSILKTALQLGSIGAVDVLRGNQRHLHTFVLSTVSLPRSAAPPTPAPNVLLLETGDLVFVTTQLWKFCLICWATRASCHLLCVIFWEFPCNIHH